MPLTPKKYLNEDRTQELINKIRTDYATKTEISAVYKPAGSVAFASLPATLAATDLGKVFDVTDSFTTDARFVEGAGITYPANTNIVVVDTDTTGSSPSYKFDVLAGLMDLTAYQQKQWATAKATKADGTGTTQATVEGTIDALIAEKFDDTSMIPITAAELTAMWTNPIS